MKVYERLLQAIEMEKDNIIKEFKKQEDIKTCKIDFTYDEVIDFYKIKIRIGD